MRRILCEIRLKYEIAALMCECVKAAGRGLMRIAHNVLWMVLRCARVKIVL
jgi:hypothetical protein